MEESGDTMDLFSISNKLQKKHAGGRPKMPLTMRKIAVHTTLHAQTIEYIDTNRWKINELILDGIEHRTGCRHIILEMQGKIAKNGRSPRWPFYNDSRRFKNE